MSIVLAIFIQSCNQQHTSNGVVVASNSDSVLIAEGNATVAAAFKGLSAKLITAIKDSGVTYAIGYCNIQALPTLDSVSRVYKVSISRVTDKYRNPNNMADSMEMKLLERYKDISRNGNTLSPTVIHNNTGPVFYKPIVIQPLCLNCHGNISEDITDSTLAVINKLYPNDKAIGYKINEIRGLWKINFKD
jgi:hypothetical protein